MKGHALSYYTNQSELYFPRSTIDLRTAIAAEIESDQKSSGGKGFYVSTPNKAHKFRADSATSAQEWVKQISQAIFRAKNDSDTVKVSLPIENMLDIDDNPVMDFAETLKIRIIDNDETFAIDEYFFSFFGHGRDALEVLQQKVGLNNINQNNPSIKDTATGLSHFSREASGLSDTDSVLAATRRDTFGTDDEAGYDNKLSESTETTESFDASSVSASQILQRSDLFYHPSKQNESKSSAATPDVAASDDISSSADLKASSSSSRLQDLMRAGSVPLQKATGIAGLLRDQSKKVRTALASESKVYYEKVTNMWAGKTMHFDDAEELTTSKTVNDSDDDLPKKPGHSERFRTYFALPASERLRASYHGYLNRVLPVFGKIYISDHNICFRNLLPTVQTRVCS